MNRIHPLLRVALVGLFLAGVLLPFVQMIATSVHATRVHPGVAVGELSWINYRNLWSRPELRASIATSTLYVLVNIAITLPVALPAAYAFSRYRFLGDRHLFLALIAFRITPPVVLSLPLFQLFSELGLTDSVVGIALAHCLFNIPVTIWILQSFMDTVPREVDESAFIDGHSLPSYLLRVLVPMIRPGIGIAAFFCFVFSWIEVVFARILTVTGGKPVSMAIDALFGFTTDLGLIMALTTVSLVPGLVMIWFVRNHLSRGFRIGNL